MTTPDDGPHRIGRDLQHLPPPPASAPPPPPPPPPPLAPPAHHHARAAPPPAAPSAVRLDPRSVAAQLAIAVNMAATGLVIWARWSDRQLVVDLRDGLVVDEAAIARVDDLLLMSGIAFVATFALAAVCFIAWFHRAYKNVAGWRYVEHRTGWAIGAWFVPILNLWRPVKIAQEIAAGSASPSRSSATRIVGVWWGLVILSNLIDRVLRRTEPETYDGALTWATVGLLSDVMWLIAGVAAIALLRQVTRDQRARIAAPVAPNPLVQRA